jgi:hypothetical protein
MAYRFRRLGPLQYGPMAACWGKGETVDNVHKGYAVQVTVTAVGLLCGLIRPVDAGVLDCVTGPLGTGNPSRCTGADRKHYEELTKQADAEVLAWKATMDYCEHHEKGPSDKCPDEYRKMIDESEAASKAKQQREYEIWLQGAEARKQEVEAKQEALLKQELAESEKQYRAAVQEEYRDQTRRNAEQFQEQQAAHQRDVDEFSRRMSQSADEIVSNANARMAADVARSAPPVAATPPAPTTRVPDPLAPNSAMQSEAARARKGAGTDLCPKEISDIECANRLEYLQEQARGQH